MLVEVERLLEPGVKSASGFYGISSDVDVAAVGAAFHDHGGAAFAFQGVVVIRGIDAEHEARVAGGDAEFAANQEAGAAEHALLGDAGHLRQRGADALCERVVGGCWKRFWTRARIVFWGEAFGGGHGRDAEPRCVGG
jgi:hypothetical protein